MSEKIYGIKQSGVMSSESKGIHETYVPSTIVGSINDSMYHSIPGVFIDPKYLEEKLATYENIVYELARHVNSMKNDNVAAMESYESRLIRMENLMMELKRQSNNNFKVTDRMITFLERATSRQNELYDMIEKISMRNDNISPKKLITDKIVIRDTILSLKNYIKTFNPGMLAVNQDWDIDVVMDVMKELRDENQLEIIDNSSETPNEIPKGFITDKTKIKQMLLASKIPDKIFNPGTFAVNNDLDIDAVLEVIEELRNEKHLVSAYE